jgi:ubiquinone/menaquinone biosynthesis C-methylase UbiE
LFEGHISEYIGVDVGNNPDADFNIEPGQQLQFEKDSFDIVLSSQVLEHVEDVDSYMKEIKRVLVKDGVLLLSTHGTWQYHASPYDYYRWTSMGMKTLMKKYGFEITHFKPILGQLALTSQLRLSLLIWQGFWEK